MDGNYLTMTQSRTMLKLTFVFSFFNLYLILMIVEAYNSVGITKKDYLDLNIISVTNRVISVSHLKNEDCYTSISLIGLFVSPK